MPRFYCPLPLFANTEIRLPGAVAHHAKKVLRLEPGDRVTLFDGDGGEYQGAISRYEKDAVIAVVLDRNPIERESPLSITIAQAVLNAEKMDGVVQKAVELGVTRIQPLGSTRGVVRLDSERARRRVDHWRNIAIAACEQCGRNRIPEIAPLTAIPDWLARLKHSGADPARFLLSPSAELRLRDLPGPAQEMVVMIGPEGGFSAEEELAAQAVGFNALALGPRVLRTETVAPAVLAAMQTLWGDF